MPFLKNKNTIHLQLVIHLSSRGLELFMLGKKTLAANLPQENWASRFNPLGLPVVILFWRFEKVTILRGLLVASIWGIHSGHLEDVGWYIYCIL